MLNVLPMLLFISGIVNAAQQVPESCMRVELQMAELSQSVRQSVLRTELAGKVGDVTLVIIVSNSSDHTIVRVVSGDFTLSDAEQGVRLYVRDAAGGTVEESKAGWRMHRLSPHTSSTKRQNELKSTGEQSDRYLLGSGSVFSAPVSMASGERFVVYRNLTREYDLIPNNTYKVRATVKDACSGLDITSQEIGIPK